MPFFRILLVFFEVPEFVRTIFNAKLAWETSVRFFLNQINPALGEVLGVFKNAKKVSNKYEKKVIVRSPLRFQSDVKSVNF